MCIRPKGKMSQLDHGVSIETSQVPHGSDRSGRLRRSSHPCYRSNHNLKYPFFRVNSGSSIEIRQTAHSVTRNSRMGRINPYNRILQLRSSNTVLLDYARDDQSLAKSRKNGPKCWNKPVLLLTGVFVTLSSPQLCDLTRAKHRWGTEFAPARNVLGNRLGSRLLSPVADGLIGGWGICATVCSGESGSRPRFWP